MILDPALASNLPTKRLLAALDCQPLILSTPMELELMKRLEKACAKLELFEGFDELIIDYELKAESLERLLESNHKANFDEIADFLAVLHDAEIETADELKTVLIEADLLEEF